MADGIEANAARAYAAGKAAGLTSHEISQIPAGEYPMVKWNRKDMEDECFHDPDSPRAGNHQGENPVD